MAETNGGITMKWIHLAVILCGQLVTLAGGYAVLKFEVEDHARRLENIEKKQDANFIPRSEYDNRHEDLIRQLNELKQEVHDLERKR